MSTPSFSLIVVGKTLEDCRPALEELQRLTLSPLEILCATGLSPSSQRNEAAKIAKGDYLVFLDNDSLVSPELLSLYKETIENEIAVAAVGGPSLYFKNEDFFSTAVQLTLSHPLALGPSRARYSKLGKLRLSSEKELILCNLCIKKEVFLQHKGFNTKLYPNEENELLNRMSEGERIYYHPQAFVSRRPRTNLLSFLKQMFSYGHGRAKHFHLSPNFFESVYLLPSLFALYISLLFSFKFPFILWLPLITYILLILILGFKKNLPSLLTPVLIFACHYAYGLGFLFFFILPRLPRLASPISLFSVDRESLRVNLVHEV